MLWLLNRALNTHIHIHFECIHIVYELHMPKLWYHVINYVHIIYIARKREESKMNKCELATRTRTTDKNLFRWPGPRYNKWYIHAYIDIATYIYTQYVSIPDTYIYAKKHVFVYNTKKAIHWLYTHSHLHTHTHTITEAATAPNPKPKQPSQTDAFDLQNVRISVHCDAATASRETAEQRKLEVVESQSSLVVVVRVSSQFNLWI